MADDGDYQKKLQRFVKRRHPEYAELEPHWNFVRDCYEGGRKWFKDNIFRYMKEGDKEFEERLKRCYRFNHSREVVDLVDKYIFKMAIARNTTDAPDKLKSFWECATDSGLNITELAKQISKNTSIYGRVWIVVDNNQVIETKTVAEEKEEATQTYAYIVTPQNVCDMSYDELGQLNWILIHEQVRDDEDPLTSTGKMIDRYRLWTRDDWTLFTVREEGQFKLVNATYQHTGSENTKEQIEVDGPHKHGLGVVPVFSADNIITNEELYSAPALIDDVAYLDRAVANYLSNLDAIIQDQTFSQLIIPAQALAQEENGYDKMREMGTKRIFSFDASGGGKPEYISPDVKQANLVLEVIAKIINEIYQTVGLAGERTKEDNALGIDNSSGVAKAYDFERVNSLLTAKADSLENIENKLAWMVMKWNGEELSEGDKFVSYPDNFDVRGLYDEFEIAARLSNISAPDEVRRYQMKTVIDKLFPQIPKADKKLMEEALEDWPVVPIEQAQKMAQATGTVDNTQNTNNDEMIGSTGSQKVGGESDNRVDDAQKDNRKEPKEDTQLKKGNK